MYGTKVLCKVWIKDKGWGIEYPEPAVLIHFNTQPDNGTEALVMRPDGTLAELPYQCVKIVLEPVC